eukprot:TRINITY_DN23732_c0_g1_i3.p1 TRINITY_DN23732_c0_g1~~TRINITY_DN23732_c0_g1_i3.p1  ORF type:complete len:321 (+),score=51.12 TRINITY_DN23732_c0_g1_i3:1119-2081(+)
MGTEDGLIVPFGYADVGLMSWGYIQPGEASVIRSPIAVASVTNLLTKVAWGDLDVLIVDTPPGTGDVLLTLTQTLQIDGAVLVTTSNEISLADLEKGIQLFEKVCVPTLAICQNMATLPCQSCGMQQDLFADAARDRLPALLERQPQAEFHKVPLDPLLSRAPAAMAPPQLRLYPYVRHGDLAERPAGRALYGLAEGLICTFLAAKGGSSSDAGKTEVRLRAGGTLEVLGADGKVRPLPCTKLRLSCRCAHCVDEFTGELKLDREKITANVGLRALSVEIVGNYGVTVKWSDGHSSLFSLKMISQLVTGAAASSPGSGGW